MPNSRFQRLHRLPVFAAVLGLLAQCFAMVADAAPVRTAHVEAELVSENTTLQAGKPFDVGLRLKMIPKWHTYWINPGDTGLATKVAWQLPDGFQAGPIQWPHPHRLPVADLMNFGYENEILLLTQLTAPATLTAGQTVPLKAHVSWLVCELECVPEQVDLAVDLKVGAGTPQADTRWSQLFSATRQDMAMTPRDWRFTAEATAQGYRLVATPGRAGLKKPGELFFFSQDEAVVENIAEQPITLEGDRVVATLTRTKDATEVAPRLRGMWVARDGWQDGQQAAAIDLDVVPSITVATAAGSVSLLTTLLLALVGGLILNLMPCVFPVLGLKILGFVDQAGEHRRRIALHGLVFTAGVLLSFWGLATLLAVLRAGGEQLGWGFQLQSPAFVFVLAAVLLVFALNMSGVFEFGLSATSVGGNLHTKSGLTGTFFTGFLATVVATPCSAPFLAPALGAAVTLPVVQSFVVFTAIGIGLSLPYLLLSVFPGAVKVLPRPGRWMETFKQVMAFPLYATVAYLVWVLAGQVADELLLNVAWGLVIVAMGVWAYGRWSAPDARRGGMRVAVAALLLLVGGGMWLGWPAQATAKKGEPPLLVWEKWSPDAVAKLQAENRIIYVDFTARWCATCQTNKKIVFHSDRVLQVFADKKVATLRADWTNSDPQITAELAKFQRSAIPFNLVYKPGAAKPVELPALLTPDIVLKEIG
jgi:thiol:disulfide interchange protein DsbD